MSTTASLVELATLIGLIIGGVGAVVVAVVWAVGKYSQTRAEIAEKTIDLLKEEVDAVRRRLDNAEEQRIHKDEKIEELTEKLSELQNADQVIRQKDETVKRLQEIIAGVHQSIGAVLPTDKQEQLNAATDIALGEERSKRRTVEEDIRRTVHEERKEPGDVG